MDIEPVDYNAAIGSLSDSVLNLQFQFSSPALPLYQSKMAKVTVNNNLPSKNIAARDKITSILKDQKDQMNALFISVCVS